MLVKTIPLEIMKSFYLNGVKDYSEGRNFPLKKMFQDCLRIFIGDKFLLNTYGMNFKNLKNVRENDIEVFKSELGWREFAYYLLYHFPLFTKENLKSNFDNFQWLDDQINFKKWSKGLTGIPIVDAGMRELWQTGYMHNRPRMIVSSFLVKKNLLIHWKRGEEWFWDCLFDADAASNSASWQWVAGTGTDSTPYFRIF